MSEGSTLPRRCPARSSGLFTGTGTAADFGNGAACHDHQRDDHGDLEVTGGRHAPRGAEAAQAATTPTYSLYVSSTTLTFLTPATAQHHPLMSAAAGAADLVALDTALDALAVFSPRRAALIECRFFGGLDVTETAAVLSISDATVLRDWRAARAWLAAELRRSR